MLHKIFSFQLNKHIVRISIITYVINDFRSILSQYFHLMLLKIFSCPSYIDIDTICFKHLFINIVLFIIYTYCQNILKDIKKTYVYNINILQLLSGWFDTQPSFLNEIFLANINSTYCIKLLLIILK